MLAILAAQHSNNFRRYLAKVVQTIRLSADEFHKVDIPVTGKTARCHLKMQCFAVCNLL